jgi:alanyl-tRNA synthetase
MTSNEIRASFLKYFESRGHRVVPSSPLVPNDDPTLLFTNAGMNQFKDTLLGREKREYTRAATSQKVMRVSGKHNDLDNVGPSHRHHTFFEMLGNFSFGDYFKTEALPYAWGLLTEVWKMDPNKLVVSIFKGDNGIPRDDEAYDIWRKLGVPADRILEFGSEDNFWQMGDTGPCGRCSEIYYVRGGSGYDPEIEIWNNVFMEFERSAGGKLTPLPAPSIDTGMGLERVTAVLQNKQSNYDTDVFTPILSRIGELTGRQYGDDEQRNVSMRVVADHIRSATFLIGDGVIPSNEWRGYVLRKIMRRAMHRAVSPHAGRRPRSRNGRRLSRHPHKPRDDRENDSCGGTPLRGGSHRRAAPSRDGDHQGPGHEVEGPQRRCGVQAVRHIRRALRLHRGHRRDAGRHGRQGRLRARDGRPT